MPVGKLTGPLKFYNVTFQYTVHNTAVGTVSATSEEEARLKIIQQLSKQVEDLIVTSVTEVHNPNDGPVDMDNLPDGVTRFPADKPN